MANNRMHLRCSCGAEQYLAKRMAIGYYSAVSEPTLNAWLENHEMCAGYPDCFTLTYEFGQDHYMGPPPDDACAAPDPGVSS